MDIQRVYYHSLLRDELMYEITIRAETPGDTVLKMKQQLKCLSAEFLPEEIMGDDLKASIELPIIAEKIKDLQAKLKTLEKSKDKWLLVRIKSLYCHLLFRLQRVEGLDLSIDKETHSLLKSKLEQCLVIIEKFLAKKDGEGSTSSSADIIAESFESGKGANNFNILKHINTKFNGLTSVHSFLEAVNERAQAFGITDDKLFNAACCLFTDQGLLWYRGNKHRFQSWKELGTLLQEEFAPVDFDYRLLEEIHARTQGQDEPTHIYFAVMSGMFSRLLKPLNDEDQLEILLHNIRPSFSEQLALQEVNSVEALRRCCRKIEAARQKGKLFSEPPKQSTLNPDFTYKGKPSLKQDAAAVASTTVQQRSQFVPPQYQKQYKPAPLVQQRRQYVSAPRVENQKTPQVGTVYCYRCKVDSHSTKACNDKRVVCFKCGEMGYTSRSCPKCRLNLKPKN